MKVFFGGSPSFLNPLPNPAKMKPFTPKLCESWQPISPTNPDCAFLTQVCGRKAEDGNCVCGVQKGRLEV